MDKLTTGEKNLILTLISNCRDEGWYYGNKEQFQSRLKSIETKLTLVNKSAKHSKNKIKIDDPNAPWNWKKDSSEL